MHNQGTRDRNIIEESADTLFKPLTQRAFNPNYKITTHTKKVNPYLLKICSYKFDLRWLHNVGRQTTLIYHTPNNPRAIKK